MLEEFNKLAFHGFKGNEEARRLLLMCFKLLGVRCSYDCNGERSIYLISKDIFGNFCVTKIEATPEVLRKYNVIDLFSYIDKLRNICTDLIVPEQWFLLLMEGDQVTIAERIAYAEDYPFNFADEMIYYVGKTFTIGRIERCSDISNYPLYNGDRRKYYLRDVGYTWHSSMFVPKFINTIRIELSELPLIL